jgi:hypothetical protein
MGDVNSWGTKVGSVDCDTYILVTFRNFSLPNLDHDWLDTEMRMRMFKDWPRG